eukprot:CFRG7014T1
MMASKAPDLTAEQVAIIAAKKEQARKKRVLKYNSVSPSKQAQPTNLSETNSGSNANASDFVDDEDFWRMVDEAELKPQAKKQRTDALLRTISPTNSGAKTTDTTSRTQRPRIDTNAGFLMPDEDLSSNVNEKNASHGRKDLLDHYDGTRKLCIECKLAFYSSYLERSFQIMLCDSCKRADKAADDKYGLVTKTTAKKEYLLTDGDLENRDYSLPYITMANPGGTSYARMKLYVRMQVEELSFKRFGGEAGLDLEIQKRQEAKLKGQKAKYKKQINELKRTTLTKIHRMERHEHEWGVPVHDSATDMSQKKCNTCGVVVEFCSM